MYLKFIRNVLCNFRRIEGFYFSETIPNLFEPRGLFPNGGLLGFWNGGLDEIYCVSGWSMKKICFGTSGESFRLRRRRMFRGWQVSGLAKRRRFVKLEWLSAEHPTTAKIEAFGPVSPLWPKGWVAGMRESEPYKREGESFTIPEEESILASRMQRRGQLAQPIPIQYFLKPISPVESRKGANDLQRCSLENQKGDIAVQSL